jgi:4-aminobutyrate aminotransferase
VHAQCSIAFHAPYLALVGKLLPIMPDKSLDSFFFWNSGSEAVEAALKLARIATGRQNIICMQGASPRVETAAAHLCWRQARTTAARSAPWR